MNAQATYTLYGQVKTYEETKVFYEAYEKRIREKLTRHATILSHVPKGSTVLDFGSGWGVFSRMIADKGCTVHGIDIDAESIKIARDFSKEDAHLKFSQTPITVLPVEHFDVVISNQVVEHVFNPGNHIKECNRVLKKGGTLLLSTPNVITPEYIYYQMSPNMKKNLARISETIGAYNKTHEHVQSWEPHNLTRLLCALGFSYLDHELMEGVPFPKIGLVQLPIPFIKNLCYTMMLKMKKEVFIDIGNND